MYPTKSRKILIFLGLFLVVVLFITFILLGIRNTSGVPVEVFVVPKNAKITINGNGSGSKTRLEPGREYVFSANAEGFNGAENRIFINEATTVPLILEPISEEAKEYAQKNQKLYLEAEGIAGKQAQQKGVEFRENNPIVDNLPYSGGYYRIDYREQGDLLIILITADSAVGRQVAFEKIRSWGYEPHDYNIEFPGFVNPFERSSAQ